MRHGWALLTLEVLRHCGILIWIKSFEQFMLLIKIFDNVWTLWEVTRANNINIFWVNNLIEILSFGYNVLRYSRTVWGSQVLSQRGFSDFETETSLKNLFKSGSPAILAVKTNDTVDLYELSVPYVPTQLQP